MKEQEYWWAVWAWLCGCMQTIAKNGTRKPQRVSRVLAHLLNQLVLPLLQRYMHHHRQSRAQHSTPKQAAHQHIRATQHRKRYRSDTGVTSDMQRTGSCVSGYTCKFQMFAFHVLKHLHHSLLENSVYLLVLW